MSRRNAIDLDDVLTLLATGTNLDQIAARLNVQAASIVRAFTRRGTPTQRARIARARAELADQKRAARAQRQRTRSASGVRIDYGRTA